MADLVNKRQRANNFSVPETGCLVNEIMKRKSVIENKRTDAVTWKQKESAWKDLTETLNTLNGTNRTVKMVNIKYDGLKRAIKQTCIKLKAEKFKTGGGTAESVQFSPSEAKLMGLMPLSVQGLSTENDSDAVKPIICPEDSNKNVETHNTSNVQLVEAEVHAALSTDVVNYDVIEVIPNFAEHEIEEVQVTNTVRNTSRDFNWNSWSPATLRTPLNKKLKTKRAPPVNSQYSSMASSREDLIKIQKKVAEQQLEKLELEIAFLHKEDARKNEESQLRTQLVIKEHNARMEILQLQKQQLLLK